MKTMIKIFTLIMIVTFTLSLESYAGTTGGGNRPKVRVMGKKRKISKNSARYSLKFNTMDINKRPKSRRRGFLANL